MMTILVPMDESDASEHAAESAAELAKAMNAEVTLVEVVQSPYFSKRKGYRTLDCDQAQKTYPEVWAYLQKISETVFSNMQTSFMVLEGPVGESLVSLIDDGAFHMVVMGTEGLGNALKRLLMGSVTKYVLSRVRVPVLVVR